MAAIIASNEQGTFRWFGRNRRLNKDYENFADKRTTIGTLVTCVAMSSAMGQPRPANPDFWQPHDGSPSIADIRASRSGILVKPH
jgi:hypothetical protein